MARSRMLKPDFFQDEDVATLDPYARLLFQGLWLIADREGRLEDRPLKIRAAIFPYEPVDVESLLSSLAKNRTVANGAFIVRYVVDGHKYIQINNFTKHQKCHPKEPASAIPALSVSSRVKPRQRPEKSVPAVYVRPESESFPSVPSFPSESISESESVVTDSVAPKGAQVVFDHWRSTLGHEHARLTSKRERLIAARIKDGYTVEFLKCAVDGCKLSPFHQGENERHTKYDDIALICRDGEHVEQFERLSREGLTKGPESKGGKLVENTRSVLSKWLENQG